MIKGLRTLIKLKRRALDDLRREITELQTKQADLQQIIHTLGEELLAEQSRALEMAEMAGFFGQYHVHIRHRQDRLKTQIQELEAQIAVKQDALRQQFQETKSFEIAEEQFAKQAAAKANGAETKMLDETALQQHLRKEDSA